MYDKRLAHKVKKYLEVNKDNRLKIKDIAKAIHLKKHKHKDLVDTLFKLVRDEEIHLKNRRYSAIRIKTADYIQGTFDATSLAKNRSFAFVTGREEDIYISGEDTLNAYHGDIVEVEVKYSRNHKRYGIIIKIVERKHDSFVGTVQEYKGKYYLQPDNSKIHTDLLIDELSNAKPGEKVVLKILNWGNREYQRLPVGNIIEVLGKAGDPEVEILSIIKQYELPLTFPDYVLSELKHLPDEIPDDEIARRKDLRNITTFTIDPASAKDFDDAISLESSEQGCDLYVHIADVAHYVQPKSKLFSEAVNRGNSYYFPKKVIPMLPEKISNKICSLRPFEDKLTVTVHTKFDHEFKIRSQEVYESVIRSNARFSYEEIDNFFDGEDINIEKELANVLKKMRKLSSALLQQRLEKGYLLLNIPETEFIFDEDGHISDLQRSRQTESHKMIENFMLIANEFVAKQLFKQKTIYRIHEEPDEKKIYELKEVAAKYQIEFKIENNLNNTLQVLLESMPDEDHHRVFDRMILRNMKRAKYSVDNYGHFGLAMQDYTHFTSPIRRLCDLTVHHQIKAKINSSSILFSPQKLFDLAGIATEKEMLADEAEHEVNLKNKIIFMKKKLGEEYSGIIVGVRPSKMIIELDRYPITGIVSISTLKDDYYEFYEQNLCFIGRKTGKIYKLTDKVKILVSKIDDDIYFQLIR
ncbi:MAG: ribonuclease R [Candidatus Cloacimonetes bacterium]|nr:ribonuclease R [Candidatus Cloacimonadota bacterium]